MSTGAPDGPEPAPRRLFVYNAGFLTQPRVRRILQLAGYSVTTGRPGDGDLVGVWGRSPTAHRGEAVSERRAAGLVRIELKKAWSDGTFAVDMDPLSLLCVRQGSLEEEEV